MTDCPTCGKPVDGLQCWNCSGSRKLVDPDEQARIDAAIAECRAKVARWKKPNRRNDPETAAERAAIEGEGL